MNNKPKKVSFYLPEKQMVKVKLEHLQMQHIQICCAKVFLTALNILNMQNLQSNTKAALCSFADGPGAK